MASDNSLKSCPSHIFTFNRSELEYIKSKNKSINIPNFSSFLSWDLYSKEAKIVKGELVYKARNFSWTTVYRLKMLNEEKGELVAEAVINNNSDMNFKILSLALLIIIILLFSNNDFDNNLL